MSKTAYGSIMITDSTDGVNAALINLYKQGTTAPSVPSTDLVYNFQNTTITGNTEGWSQTTGGFSPTITTWIITAMALSSESTDTILSGEWSVPVQVSDSSTPAQDGLNQATVFIYIRSNTTPQTPANASYTFANGAFTAPSGWSKTIPGANGKPCFVTSAVAIGRGATATLAWVTPTKLAEDGAKGEDGFSPVVTSTSTGVQIEDKDGHITYINNGTNGQTYYTHIRYSSKATPTAASDVSTSPTGKSYMGIQTTTSQTAPAWNNSGWTWVKYVGENGQPGAQGNPGEQGVSVTSVRELYYLTQGSQPSKPTSSTTIVSTDTINVWTTTLPSYVANGKYYVSLETTLSNSTKVWSNVSLDKATTDANYNAYLAMSASQHAEENSWGAMSIASDTRQYFWNLTTDYSTNVKAGTYITKIPNDAFKTNPSAGGANIFMQNAGIWLRNGLDNLATLQGTGLYLYVPEGTYKGKKGMSLTKDALTFYNIDSTNGVAATLNANGLRIARGGVYGGSTSDLNNFVFLSTQDFGNSVTVNSHAATDWRLLINNKFGVDKAGNLYASNATIQGKVTVGAGSNVYTTDSVNPLDLGGRNILRGTEDITMTASIWSKSGWYKSGTGTITTQVALTDSPIPHITKGVKVTATAANTNCGPAQGGIPLRPGKIVLSAWVKGTAGDKVTIQTIWTNADSTRKETGESKTYTIADSNWHRYSATATVVYNHPVGTTTSAADNTFVNGGYVYFQSATVNHTCLICGIKMEYGNEPTDWTPYEGSIVEVSGGGIRVADVMDLTNYLQINSTDISMWRNSNKMMSLGNSSLIFYDGTGTTDADKYAEFGSTIKIFNPTKGTAAVTINASGASFTGNVKATSLSTGTKTASTTGKGTYIASDGAIYSGDGSNNYFTVSAAGALTAKSGTIGGWSISSNDLWKKTNGDNNGSKYFCVNANNVGTTSYTLAAATRANSAWNYYFYVRGDGYLFSKSGNIGGWNISSGYLYKQTAAATAVNGIQYEAGLRGNDGTPSTGATAFYVAQRTCTAYSNNTPTYGSWSYPFKVNYDGSIAATKGTIGGWTLGTDSLYKYADSTGATVAAAKAKYYVYIQSTAGTNGGNYAFALRSRTDAQVTANSPVIGSADVQFGVTWAGYMYAKNAEIVGKITAEKGKIGGWNISSTALCSATTYAPASGRILLAPAGIKTTSVIGALPIGTWAITASDQFGVTTGGKLYANGAVISGTLTAGANSKIGPWTVSDSAIYNGKTAVTNTNTTGVYLGTDGLNISGGTAATTAYITKSAVNIGNKLTWNGTTLSINGAITATSLTLSDGVTIAQSKVYGLTDALNGKAASGAENTAKNYLDYTQANGLRIAQSSPSSATTNMVQIKANDIRVYGNSANGYTKITSSGMEVFANINNTATSIASFGASARIGKDAAPHIAVTSSEIQMWKGASSSSANKLFSISTNNNLPAIWSTGEIWIESGDSSSGYSSLHVSGAETGLQAEDSNYDAGLYVIADGQSIVNVDAKYFQLESGCSLWYLDTAPPQGSQAYNAIWHKSPNGNYGLYRPSSSSRRYKEDIKPVEDDRLDPHRLYDIEVMQFKFKEGTFEQDDPYEQNRVNVVGFIAEDVLEHYPQAAIMIDDKVENWDERYIIPPMLKLIQEQNERIKELEEQVRSLL